MTPFQPAPYFPLAKIPKEITPQSPLTPCTEIAPTGSSTPTLSQKNTLSTTITPAMAPITAAAQLDTNAHGAVIATRPASMPLHIMEGSGFLPVAIMNTIEAREPVTPASIVFTTMCAILRSVPERVEPGLNPNQPKARTKVPTTAMGMLWPGMACGFPLTYLPMRGPIHMAPARAMAPPMACTTPDPAKSTAPCPQPQFLPACANQPPPQTQLAKRQYGSATHS